MKEKAVLFGQSGSLIGVITNPSKINPNHRLPAFIFLNSGVIHRIGPNRLSVRMARDLASIGFTSFRFDLSGLGDSRVGGKDLTFDKRWTFETQEAMNFVEQESGINQFVLAGNCSGAAIAFLTAIADKRVTGAVLINPQGPKKFLRYYMRLALFNPKFALRFISGKAKYRKEIDRISSQYRNFFQGEPSNVYGAEEIATDLRLLIKRGADMLIVHCEWDPGWDYFKAKLGKTIRELSAGQKLKTKIIYGINHDFSVIHGQEALIRIVRDWASQIVCD